ncbi:DUF1648 domain-containing protein [Brachybacterium tyrofermentans]|uniref:DUF1648 domain-containing protein n=1 Tax=Brachybacterium tyrofermentans TaxID=47848 RepID=A0ABW0FI80_9MICO|nr:hypothetical protein FM103_06210 [Corynebacterium xerosis]
MTNSRPARTYRTSLPVRILRAIGLLGALTITIWLVLAYRTMPQTIATHFGPGGAADDYGSKVTALVLAALMVALTLFLAVLSLRPSMLNYPTVITKTNAQAIYREGERMLVLALVSMQVVYLGLGRSVSDGAGSALLALGLVLLVACMVLGIVRLVRAARTDEGVAA